MASVEVCKNFCLFAGGFVPWKNDFYFLKYYCCFEDKCCGYIA